MTWLFTDVVGSTKLWAADPERTARSFVVHDAIVRSVLTEHQGEIFGWAGDSFRAGFASRTDAIDAANAVHIRLAEGDWGDDPTLRVRIGVTHGPGLARDGDYFGPILNTAARLEQAAQPGQTVVSAAVVAGLRDVAITALGRHRVRDVADELELFQLGTQTFSPLRTVDATLSTLPLARGELVGRSSLVAEVRAALDERQPVTVVGTGGAGKTRLALEVAHLELSDYPDGCYFVDFAPVTDPELVSTTLARGSRFKLAGAEPIEEIVDHFASRRALLLLDNCEHLLTAVQPIVEQLAVGAPDLAVLATSREALGVAGERVVPVGPLAVEAGGPAVELFVQRVAETVTGFSPSQSELVQIAEICDHLDGIPLALELAAARAGVLGLDHLLEGMHDRFRMLSSSRSDGTRTLREAIDWSFGLLDESEQDFFTRCGVFSGSFDLRAASAIANEDDPLDVADLLHSLVRKSLIAIDSSVVGRFRLLETIRAYSLLRLDDLGATDAVRHLHFKHYCDLGSVDGLGAALDLDRAVVLSEDWSNLASALEWGIRGGFFTEAARLATGCLGIWEHSVPAAEGRRWIDDILGSFDDGAPDLAGPERWTLQFGLVSLEAQLDNFERVFELMTSTAACPIAEVQGAALAASGYLQAREAPERSEQLFGLASDLIALHDLGDEPKATLAWARGAKALYEPRIDAAYDFFRDGFDVAQQAEHRTASTIYTGLGLAVVQLLMGRPADALATIDSYRWSDSRWDSSPIIRGVALIDLGRADEAADAILDFAHESLHGRLRRMSNDALIGLSALALHRGESDHGWLLLQQAITPRTPFTIGLAEGLADRLGKGDELRTTHRSRQVALSELDAIDDLRAELDRLTTEKTEQAEQTAIA